MTFFRVTASIAALLFMAAFLRADCPTLAASPGQCDQATASPVYTLGVAQPIARRPVARTVRWLTAPVVAVHSAATFHTVTPRARRCRLGRCR